MKSDRPDFLSFIKDNVWTIFQLIIFIFLVFYYSSELAKCFIYCDYSYIIFEKLLLEYIVVLLIFVWALSLCGIAHLISILRKEYLNLYPTNRIKWVWIAVIVSHVLLFICIGIYAYQMINIPNKYNSEMFSPFDNICDYSNLDSESFVKQDTSIPFAEPAEYPSPIPWAVYSYPYTYPTVEEMLWTTRFSFEKDSTYISTDESNVQSIYIKEKVLVINNAKMLNYFLCKRTVHEEKLTYSDSENYYYKYDINTLGNGSHLLMVYHDDDYFILYEMESSDPNLTIEKDVVLNNLKSVI